MGSYLGSIAKAVAAFVVGLIAGFLTDKGIILDDNNGLSAAVEAIILAFLVWVVPNRPYPVRTTETRHVA